MGHIIKLIAQLLLLPLIEKGVKHLNDEIKKYFEEKKLKQENAKKKQEFENAETIEDIKSTFEKLP